MRTFACVVGANCNSPMLQFIHIANLSHIAKFTHIANSPMLSIAFNGRANCPQRKGELPSKEGRIADNGWANCNSPLHVCYPNVGKYYMQIASRAWHRFFCVRRRGELKFAHTAICPCYKFVHIVNSSILKFAHTTIRPCCN